MTKSELDNIKGIGDILKKRLLSTFKNIENIKLASLKELMSVDGISEKMAQSIKKEIKS